MVLAVQCTDWWGYVGSCPGPLLCINTWGCFLGSLSDFWGHKKIFWDVQDFSYRVCQTDLAGINISDFKIQGSSLVFSSPGPIVQVSFICLWSLVSNSCVIFVLAIEATGAISTNLAQSIICFNAEHSPS